MLNRACLWSGVGYLLVALSVPAQQPAGTVDVSPNGFRADSTTAAAANPQMERLARSFVGRWRTHEVFAKNEFYPTGAERTGTAQFELATGGTILIEKVFSDGSAGKLDFMVVIWWDGADNTYKLFTCGNAGTTPCRLRGVARWEGDNFVNDYELTIRGRNHSAKDSFEHISRQSVTLVASADLGREGMMPIITTTYTKLE